MLKQQLRLPLLEILESIQQLYVVYSSVRPTLLNTSYRCCAVCKNEKIDLILGFGGGSSMGVAKLIAIFGTS